MKINILSPGRFHVCDLARELDACGHDVKFYSFVSAKRSEKFGLPRHCSKSLLWFMAPFLFLERVAFKKNRFFADLSVRVQDIATAWYMRECDVVIAMSGNFVYSLRMAKQRGAFVVLERGSKHILDQKRILESVPSLQGKEPVPASHVIREMQGYALADCVAIASEHVKESFLQNGYPVDKLFLNPYGVDLAMFYREAKAIKEYDVIMVGGWSYQKGCDLIVDALKDTSLKFLHVGSIGDLEFPDLPNFTHQDSVDQSTLVKYYNKAKVFLLPSRQDGFGMVLAQALACGLPLVCTKDTGGQDIGAVTGLENWVFVMPDFTEESLRLGIQNAMQFARSQEDAQLDLKDLTWGAYGRRYEAFLMRLAVP